MSQNNQINLENDGIWINGVFASEITVTFLKSTLGEPRIVAREGEDLTLLWDTSGIVAYTNDDNESVKSLCLYPSLNEEKKYWDTPEADFSGSFFIEKKTFMESIPHKKLAEAYLCIEKIKIGNWELSAEISKELQEKIKAYGITYRTENPDEIADLVRNASLPFHAINISFKPKKVSVEKNLVKATEDRILVFDNFNFKLAIIQELMYNKELIKPKFDVYAFAKDYANRQIDVNNEGYTPIQEVKTWFDMLPVSAALAQHVEELYLDGGNEIYGQIIPHWDGEDSFYDIEDISPEELVQFPRLKRVIVEMTIGKKARAALNEAGVEVKG